MLNHHSPFSYKPGNQQIYIHSYPDVESCGRAYKGGVDAKELFHLYVVLWIQEKRLNLLDFCKFDKVSWQCLSSSSKASYCFILYMKI